MAAVVFKREIYILHSTVSFLHNTMLQACRYLCEVNSTSPPCDYINYSISINKELEDSDKTKKSFGVGQFAAKFAVDLSNCLPLDREKPRPGNAHGKSVCMVLKILPCH